MRVLHVGMVWSGGSPNVTEHFPMKQKVFIPVFRVRSSPVVRGKNADSGPSGVGGSGSTEVEVDRRRARRRLTDGGERERGPGEVRG